MRAINSAPVRLKNICGLAVLGRACGVAITGVVIGAGGAACRDAVRLYALLLTDDAKSQPSGSCSGICVLTRGCSIGRVGVLSTATSEVSLETR